MPTRGWNPISLAGTALSLESLGGELRGVGLRVRSDLLAGGLSSTVADRLAATAMFVDESVRNIRGRELSESTLELARFRYRGPPPDVFGPARVLTIVRDNFDTFDSAHSGGDDVDGEVGLKDLKAIVDPDNGYGDTLRRAAQYLLDNPEMFDRLEVANDGGYYEGGRDFRRDGKFRLGDVDAFFEQNRHLRSLIGAFDDADIAHRLRDADGWVSRDDLEALRDRRDEDGSYAYPSNVRSAADYLLDHDSFFRSISTFDDPQHTNTRGFSWEALASVVLEHHALADSSRLAHAFVLEHAGRIPSHSDGSVKALAAAALAHVRDSRLDRSNVIVSLPETSGGVRNMLITAMYAEFGTDIDRLLGEQSGINWSTWAVWASEGVGTGIRGEARVPLVWQQKPQGGDRDVLAEGNLMVFAELGPLLDKFVRTVESGTEAEALAFLESIESPGVRAGLTSWWEAVGAVAPQAKQELVLLGNLQLLEHEQTRLDPLLDDLFDPPWYGDLFNKISGNLVTDRINEALRAEWPGFSASASFDVPVESQPIQYENLLDDYDGLGNDDLRELFERYQASGGTGSSGPHTLDDTYADDWNDLNERMYFIAQLWRIYHTNAGAQDVSSVDYSSLDWLAGQ